MTRRLMSYSKLIALTAFLMLTGSYITLSQMFSDGDGTDTNPYKLRTKADFDTLAKYVNSGTTFAGHFFKLERNIIEDSITQIIGTNTDARAFQGDFEGNRCTLAVSINSSATYIGLFGSTKNAKIRNLTVIGFVNAIASVDPGAIVGYASNTIFTNCHNEANVTFENGHYTGGIAGTAVNSSIDSCTNRGAITGLNYTAGIVGHATNTPITNCKNYGVITGRTYTAGIVGLVSITNKAVTISNNINYGNVDATGYNYAGGIIGSLTITTNDSAVGCSLTKNQNLADTIIGSAYVGGIIGHLNIAFSSLADNVYKGCTLTTNTNSASIIGTNSYVGGIIGYLNISNARISSILTGNKNSGAVTTAIANSYIGGVIGYFNMTNAQTCTLSSNSNTGDISGNNFAGGIVGSFNTSNNVQSSTLNVNFNVGNIKGNNNVAGIIGHINTTHLDVYVLDVCSLTENSNANSVTGTSDVGGIIGRMANAKVVSINKSTSIGNISGTTNVGGIIGYSQNLNLANAMNAGIVSGSNISNTSNIGGIVGHINTSSHLYRCLNVGNIQGGNVRTYVGSIAGRFLVTTIGATIDNCYYDTQMSSFKGIGNTAGGQDTIGTIGYTEGRATKAMTGRNNLFDELGGNSAGWSYTDSNNFFWDIYPKLPTSNANPDINHIANVAAAPIFINNDDVHISQITKNFRASGANNMKWRALDSNAQITTTAGSRDYNVIVVEKDTSDILEVYINNNSIYKKHIPIGFVIPKNNNNNNDSTIDYGDQPVITAIGYKEGSIDLVLEEGNIIPTWTTENAEGVLICIHKKPVNSNIPPFVQDYDWITAFDTADTHAELFWDPDDYYYVRIGYSNMDADDFIPPYEVFIGLELDTEYYMTMVAYDADGIINESSFDYIDVIVNSPQPQQQKLAASLPTRTEFVVSDIYPSPVIDEANIKINVGEEGNMNVFILDLSGAKVMELVSNQFVNAGTEITIPINLYGLPSGMYAIVVTIGADRNLKTFIKQQ